MINAHKVVFFPPLLFNDENSQTTVLENLLCAGKLNCGDLAQLILKAKVRNTHLSQFIQFDQSNSA